jgi:hypothetical protein
MHDIQLIGVIVAGILSGVGFYFVVKKDWHKATISWNAVAIILWLLR